MNNILKFIISSLKFPFEKDSDELVYARMRILVEQNELDYKLNEISKYVNNFKAEFMIKYKDKSLWTRYKLYYDALENDKTYLDMWKSYNFTQSELQRFNAVIHGWQFIKGKH